MQLVECGLLNFVERAEGLRSANLAWPAIRHSEDKLSTAFIGKRTQILQQHRLVEVLTCRLEFKMLVFLARHRRAKVSAIHDLQGLDLLMGRANRRENAAQAEDRRGREMLGLL